MVDKTYPHTINYKEHKFAVTFGNGACGQCPFPANHPIHIKGNESPVLYSVHDPNASWNRPK